MHKKVPRASRQPSLFTKGLLSSCESCTSMTDHTRLNGNGMHALLSYTISTEVLTRKSKVEQKESTAKCGSDSFGLFYQPHASSFAASPHSISLSLSLSLIKEALQSPWWSSRLSFHSFVDLPNLKHFIDPLNALTHVAFKLRVLHPNKVEIVLEWRPRHVPEKLPSRAFCRFDLQLNRVTRRERK